MDTSTLLSPLAGDNPGGSDSRYEPEYEALIAEVEKLNSPRALECDWSEVEKQAATILESKSKDFQVACYLCEALQRRHGLEGIAQGANFLAGLVTRYWETGFPVLKRVRGRVNALEWWKDHTERALDALLADMDARFDARLLQSLEKGLGDLESAMGEKYPDFPSLRPLMDRARRLVPEPADDPNGPDDSTLSANPTAETSAPTETSRGTSSAAAARSEAQADVTTQGSSGASGSSGILAMPAALSDNAQENLRTFTTFALALGDSLLAEDSADPMGWQVLYAAHWGALRTLPQADNGTTMLPPPQEEEREAIAHLVASGRHQMALTACTQIWGQHLFWLDIHCLAATSLQALGPKHAQALAVVCQECLLFVKKLPGVEALNFGDGTPFANARTRQWLDSLGGGEMGTAVADPCEEAMAQARRLFANQKPAEALEALEKARMATPDMAARLRLRLEQGRFLMRANHVPAAAMVADELVEEADTLKIGLWDRDLARDILVGARVAYEALGTEEGMRKLNQVTRALARVAPGALLQ